MILNWIGKRPFCFSNLFNCTQLAEIFLPLKLHNEKELEDYSGNSLPKVVKYNSQLGDWPVTRINDSEILFLLWLLLCMLRGCMRPFQQIELHFLHHPASYLPIQDTRMTVCEWEIKPAGKSLTSFTMTHRWYSTNFRLNHRHWCCHFIYAAK